MRIFWVYHASWYVSSVPSYALKRLSWKFPLRSKNEGFLGVNYPTGWDLSLSPKAHPWPKPHRLIFNLWASCARGHMCACPISHRKQTKPVDNFTHMGSRDPPAYHYQIWFTWWSRWYHPLYKFLLRSVKDFLFCKELKLPFPLLSDHCL
jgi:hypothetical protein